MHIKRIAATCLVVTTIAVAAGADKALDMLKRDTGLVPITIPNTEGAYLGKTHRGYEVIYTAKSGNVWGRYAARLTAGEIGKEVGGVLGHVTGQRVAVDSQIVGSPLDRALSEIIGQPLAVTFILKHDKANAPRLDIASKYSVLADDVTMPEQARINMKAGAIYSDDAAFAAKLANDKDLMARLKRLRGEYIRVDPQAVTFLWSGAETDYSGMVTDHGGYSKMMNAIMDDLADIADAIPAAATQ